jgi:PPK2 family polyphosphate:nucleotide phosphotransferase
MAVIISEILKAQAGSKFVLSKRDPADRKGLPEDKAARNALTAQLGEKLNGLQDRFAAEKKTKLLLVLQGMDTSGKDGTVKAVFDSVNPLGIRVAPFKAPTERELAHDYLWRVHAEVPQKGEIVIFNRSHYEDVLITRVHGWIDADEVARRLAHINDFERMLVETGTVIIKCMLHISKDEQAKRLEERRTDPAKQYKFNVGDIEERKYWDKYMTAYEEAIRATSTEHAPWYVIPANSNSTRNAYVAQLLTDALEAINPKYPKPTQDLSKIVVV